jgi:microcystin-dependent protein
MAILNNPEDFVSGENITAAKLNNLVDGATFLGGAGQATDDSTLEVNDGVGGDGSLRVKDLGITSAKLADDAVIESKIADNAVTASKIAPSAATAIMPVGGVLPYAGATSPTGWLLCSGKTIGNVGSGADFASADYETLFDLIKSHYGNAGTEDWASGDTVLLPDLRGRVIAGLDNMGGTSADRLTNPTSTTNSIDGDGLGNTGGHETHQLIVAELAEHSHTYTKPLYQYLVPGGPGLYSHSSQTAATSTGSDQAHNNVQPTIILNYIIKF